MHENLKCTRVSPELLKHLYCSHAFCEHKIAARACLLLFFCLLILNISSLRGFRGQCTVQGCCETQSGTGCKNTADGTTLNGAFDASSSGGILGLPHAHQLVFRSSGHWGGTA